MDTKDVYEEAGALAELLPADQRERFAALLLSVADPYGSPNAVARETAVRRWARDAGHLPRHHHAGNR
jgi:hypothetical protein